MEATCEITSLSFLLYKSQNGIKKRDGTILKNSTKKGDSGTDVFLSILGNL